MSDPTPKGAPTVVSVLVLKDGKVLMGKRTAGRAGAGEWGNPAGWLEHLESFEEAAKRELMEECGIEIANVRFSSVVNVTHYAPHHAVLVNVIADWESGEVENLEPEKCEGWEWRDLDDLPEPLTDGTCKAIEGFRTGKDFFDGDADPSVMGT